MRDLTAGMWCLSFRGESGCTVSLEEAEKQQSNIGHVIFRSRQKSSAKSLTTWLLSNEDRLKPTSDVVVKLRLTLSSLERREREMRDRLDLPLSKIWYLAMHEVWCSRRTIVVLRTCVYIDTMNKVWSISHVPVDSTVCSKCVHLCRSKVDLALWNVELWIVIGSNGGWGDERRWAVYNVPRVIQYCVALSRDFI